MQFSSLAKKAKNCQLIVLTKHCENTCRIAFRNQIQLLVYVRIIWSLFSQKTIYQTECTNAPKINHTFSLMLHVHQFLTLMLFHCFYIECFKYFLQHSVWTIVLGSLGLCKLILSCFCRLSLYTWTCVAWIVLFYFLGIHSSKSKMVNAR